jgi:hypothetical protein
MIGEDVVCRGQVRGRCERDDGSSQVGYSTGRCREVDAGARKQAKAIGEVYGGISRIRRRVRRDRLQDGIGVKSDGFVGRVG